MLPNRSESFFEDEAPGLFDALAVWQIGRRRASKPAPAKRGQLQ
jgi:hypothetical protein